VNHADTDAELLQRARAGAAPAFAVLVYRYAALLHAGASTQIAVPSATAASTGNGSGEPGSGGNGSGGPGSGGNGSGGPHAGGSRAGGSHDGAASSDPAALDTVRRTFLRAMRRLDRADGTALGRWLLDLQGTPLTDDDADHAAPLSTVELDRLWSELAPRWPRGRRPARPPRWVGQVAIVVVLLALSIAVPYALLVTASEEAAELPVPTEEAVAVPIQDDEFDLRFEDEMSDTELTGSGSDASDEEPGSDAGPTPDEEPGSDGGREGT